MALKKNDNVQLAQDLANYSAGSRGYITSIQDGYAEIYLEYDPAGKAIRNAVGNVKLSHLIGPVEPFGPDRSQQGCRYVFSRWWFLILILLLTGGSGIALIAFDKPQYFVFVVALIFVIVTFVFTWPLDNPDKYWRALTRMLQISYVFAFVLLVLVLMPFLSAVPALFGDPEQQAPVKSMLVATSILHRPFNVLRGCSAGAAAVDTRRALGIRETDCETGSSQWVFSFGGIPEWKAHIEISDYVSSARKEIHADITRLTAKQGELMEKLSVLKRERIAFEAQISKLEIALEEAERTDRAAVESEIQQINNAREAVDDEISNLAPFVDYFDKAYEILLAIEASYFDVSGYKIYGGLVVPVYFVFIAIAGGVVSMLRRLPEIQRRSLLWITAQRVAGTGEKQTLDPEALPIERVREQLIFQIVQVITAPFLSILAYAMITPESTYSTTIIAFAAGFASEPFLMQVRNVADGISQLGKKTGATTPQTEPSGKPTEVDAKG